MNTPRIELNQNTLRYDLFLGDELVGTVSSKEGAEQWLSDAKFLSGDKWTEEQLQAIRGRSTRQN